MRTRLPPLRRILTGSLVVLGSAAAGLVISAWLHHDGASPPAAVTTPSPSAASFLARDARNARPLAGRSLIVRARHQRLRIYHAPHGHRIVRVLHTRRIAARRVPIVMLAISNRRGWVHVRLPTRPNLSTGWVRRHDVRFTATSLRVTVRQHRHRLILRDRNAVVLRARIAVGKALSPTPIGRYFVTDVLRPPNPKGFYGPYALGLSAYSPVYTTFAGGNGQVGLHGTNDPSTIGSDVSHGCIRLDNTVITRLARSLPLGTPVDITR